MANSNNYHVHSERRKEKLTLTCERTDQVVERDDVDVACLSVDAGRSNG